MVCDKLSWSARNLIVFCQFFTDETSSIKICALCFLSGLTNSGCVVMVCASVFGLSIKSHVK